MLYVSLLSPCLDSEKLCIAVDLMKGTFLVSLAQKGETLPVLVVITAHLAAHCWCTTYVVYLLLFICLLVFAIFPSLSSYDEFLHRNF